MGGGLGKFFRLLLAVALLMLLLIGIDAAFDPWRDVIEPRAFRAIRGIVETFAGRPLGLDGLTFWLLVAGGSATLWAASSLAARRKRIARQPRPEPPAIAKTPPNARQRQVGAPVPTAEEPAADDEPIDFAALFNLDKVIEPLPAWRLVETSPELATSWLGGIPYAPQDFEWPASADGRPMLFVAQIDLSGVAFPGLAGNSTLLVFLGMSGDGDFLAYRIRTLSNDAVAAGAPIDPPTGSLAPREIGWHQNAGALLQATPVRLEAYLDADSDRAVSKLFGVEVQDPHGFPYPDGFRNLLFIHCHERLGTFLEHWLGMSIACPSADLDRGELNTGRIFGMHTG